MNKLFQIMLLSAGVALTSVTHAEFALFGDSIHKSRVEACNAAKHDAQHTGNPVHVSFIEFDEECECTKEPIRGVYSCAVDAYYNHGKNYQPHDVPKHLKPRTQVGKGYGDTTFDYGTRGAACSEAKRDATRSGTVYDKEDVYQFSACDCELTTKPKADRVTSKYLWVCSVTAYIGPADGHWKRKKKTPIKEAEAPSGPEMVKVPGRNFEIGKYEVTQKEWQAVMGSNPSKFTACGENCPVEKVSWDDIQVFLQKLNTQTGKQYRLPTEAEWEYACYGGSQSEFCGGNNLGSVGWYDGNSGDTTHPVGQKQANGYGLFDMTGNVWEWLSDCNDGNCGYKVLRGGSWIDAPQIARAASRSDLDPASRNYHDGFRLARTLP